MFMVVMFSHLNSGDSREFLNIQVFDAVAGLPQIVCKLHTQPCFRRGTEGLGKAEGHFDGYAGLEVDEVRQGLSGHAKALGHTGYGQTQGFKAIIFYNLARMGRVLHWHSITLSLFNLLDQRVRSQYFCISSKSDCFFICVSLQREVSQYSISENEDSLKYDFLGPLTS